MKVRTKWYQRVMLRLLLVPAILKGKRPIPEGARSPRELVASETPGDKATLTSRLESLTREFEDAIEKNPSSSITHAYFGRFNSVDALRFTAIHTEHHRRQIAALR